MGRRDDRQLRQQVDGLPAPRPIRQGALVFRLQQLREFRIARALLHEPHQVPADVGDLDALGERRAQRHQPVLADLDGCLRVQPGDGQPFVDQLVAVARPHPERVTGLVGHGFFWQVENQVPHVFC